MIFHIEFGSVVSCLRPLGIKLRSDHISHSEACLIPGLLSQYRHHTWFALKKCSQCIGSEWPFQDAVSLACGQVYILTCNCPGAGGNERGVSIQAQQKVGT